MALLDEWPQLLRKRQATFLAVVCLASFLVGLSCVTEVGSFFLNSSLEIESNGRKSLVHTWINDDNNSESQRKLLVSQ